MNISKIQFTHLHNDEHYTFHLGFKDLVVKYNPATLNIVDRYNVWLPLLANEMAANQKVSQSLVADEIIDVDNKRDNIFRGLRDAVHSGINHFNPAVKQAAERLLVSFSSYGNVTVSSYDDETAAIIGLINKLRTIHDADITALGVIDWVNELETANNTFAALMKARGSESLTKSQLVMKQERAKIDEAYRAIIKRLSALMELNGDAAYADFVIELNSSIDRLSNIIAMRRGNGKNTTTPPVA